MASSNGVLVKERIPVCGLMVVGAFLLTLAFSSRRENALGRIGLLAPRICPITLASCAFAQATCAGSPAHDPCSRPAPGAEVPEARNLYSEHGVLNVDLSIHNHREPDGSVRYCDLLPDGSASR